MKPLTYKDAGVDIDAGNDLVEEIKPLVKKTLRPEVLAGLGGFGGLFALPAGRYREPVLVSGTDGVGTKLMLAQQLDRHDTIGIDLVAMCVNDVLVQGAEPLFFLDYFACGRLDVATAKDVVAGIAEGCLQAGAALIGGETAEMPDMYADGEYDLAGFCVGAAERSEMIDGSSIAAGDALIGIASSGPHSNGYSLIRKVIDIAGDADLDALIQPTRIYVKPVLELMKTVDVKGLSHITGGGITENLPRILPGAHFAARCSRRHRHHDLAARARFRLAAGEGQHRDRRDASHVQLWRRHDRGRCIRGCGQGNHCPQRARRESLADRRSRERRGRG